MKILFVCEGNMMRSQMAELFYNSMTQSNDASSAGATAEIKDHISPRAVEAMAQVSIDASKLKPKQLTKDIFNQVDQVIYFPSDYMPDYVINDGKSVLWEIADPHYNKEKGMPFVCAVRDDIKTKVEKFIEEQK